MDMIDILAQIQGNTPAGQGSIIPVNEMWQYVKTLRLVESLTFISFGVVWLFYGWRVFKILVTICFCLFGLFVGVWLNGELIGGEVVFLSALFMVLFGFGAVWFMKWAVSCLGGAAAAVLACGVWMACGFPEHLVWAGALVGFVGGGMMSFIIFKAAVILFTSLGGGMLCVTGILAILYNHLDTGARLEEMVFQQRWFLPIMLIIPMIVGMVIQHRFMKGSEEPTL